LSVAKRDGIAVQELELSGGTLGRAFGFQGSYCIQLQRGLNKKNGKWKWVLAHELAHIWLGHVKTDWSSLMPLEQANAEVEADRFAGWIMYGEP
jgi:hypothetical protein